MIDIPVQVQLFRLAESQGQDGGDGLAGRAGLKQGRGVGVPISLNPLDAEVVDHGDHDTRDLVLLHPGCQLQVSGCLALDPDGRHEVSLDLPYSLLHRRQRRSSCRRLHGKRPLSTRGGRQLPQPRRCETDSHQHRQE
jgi:hypothetical protein